MSEETTDVQSTETGNGMLMLNGVTVPNGLLEIFAAMTAGYRREQIAQAEERRIVPTGYTRDGKGRFVPDELIAQRDRIESDLVDEAHLLMAAMSAGADYFRGHVHIEADCLVSMAICDAGGSKAAQEPGKVTLNNLDCTRRLQIDRRATKSFTPEVAAARERVMHYFAKKGKGADQFILELAKKAFLATDTGEISVSKVNDLLSVPCNDPEWIDIKQQVRDAMRADGLKTYTRLYARKTTNDKFNLCEVKI
jgi:hypothetical protein